MITKKQFLKRRTHMIAYEIHCWLSEPPYSNRKEVIASYPKVSYYKDSKTGEVRVGLSLRGIRKLVKKWPFITTEQVRKVFNVS